MRRIDVSEWRPQPSRARHSARGSRPWRANLDKFLLEARQRPVFDRFGRGERAQEVAEIVGERVKLKADGVGGERAAREPSPSDRSLGLLDPLLAGPALVVEGDDVGDDEADARVKFARMPLDLGDDPTRLRPGSGLMGEVRIGTAHFVRRSPHRAREQVAGLIDISVLSKSRYGRSLGLGKAVIWRMSV